LGSGFQPEIVRAHSRACAVSVMPGNGSGELAATFEGSTDRGGLGLGDDEHPPSMGTRIMTGKSLTDTVSWP
jgi:hypothetical protein